MIDCKFRIIWNLEEFAIQENFYTLYFNTKLDVIGCRKKIADGVLYAVIGYMRLIMSSALLINARRIAKSLKNKYIEA
ncbi:JAB domain-containing protein [Sphingobacterium bovistauri]|uniref:JAB domain-containing protein n=1 Tax=Sphingobacterium bovistauri TaxID=2781959 RepID=UPI001CE17E07|nr:JAB domain-containing protein [Sphingobacterium bovistauri]